MTSKELDEFLEVAKKYGAHKIKVGDVELELVPGFRDQKLEAKVNSEIATEVDKPEVSEDDLFGASDKPNG
jgi:hypothetical protein